jgi:hypothetical protein
VSAKTSVGSRVLALAALASLSAAGVAEADERATVKAARAADRTCHAGLARTGAPGVDVRRYTAEADGLVRARLSGSGDWDLGVFDARTGRAVAGSAALRANELAEGFVRRGQRLVVQACRVRGASASARLRVSTLSLPRARSASDARTQVVTVRTDRRGVARLQAAGLDVTEHAGAGGVDVVLHGARDEAALRATGMRFDVKIRDVAAHDRAERRADRAYAQGRQESDLPSGNTAYRRLPDFEAALKDLAMRYPALAKPITLSHPTIEGRDITGIEITRDPQARDGKPTFLNMGAHHAREWPSAEHALELAYDLLTRYGQDERATRLVNEARTIVVPIVNPDGFNVSREAQSLPEDQRYSDADLEYRRKNCRVAPGTTTAVDCSTLARSVGVDLNRNYAGFWGGPGASPDPADDTYRGEGPASEPEVRAVRDLIASRQITSLITNHTYGNLVLRPPGVAAVGFAVDEPLLRALGARFADANRYANIPSFQLYDTTGSTEDWSYWTAGGLGYTFEIGNEGFHPEFADAVVGEYLGRAPAAGAGRGGNREAYYRMLEATLDASSHSVIAGQAPEGATLTIAKEFRTETSPVLQPGAGGELIPTAPIVFGERLESSMVTDRDGEFSWAVNPSTRPYVAGRYGREPLGPVPASQPIVNPPGVPAQNQEGDILDGATEEATFTVPAPPEGDAGIAYVDVTWTNPETDWDVYVYDATGAQVASAATGGRNAERVTIGLPEPGTYTIRFVNYAQVEGAPVDDWTGSVSFAAPNQPVPGVTEAWTLTCTRPDGAATTPQQVTVARGETADVGEACAPAAG